MKLVSLRNRKSIEVWATKRGDNLITYFEIFNYQKGSENNKYT
jgi:hypothetical protein